MDLTLIATFLELASTGSFSRTAERVHITQSAVSARIKSLEIALDCRLFDRDHNGATLTSAGQRFLVYANGMNRLWLQGRQAATRSIGVASQLSAGVHICLWRRLSLPWIESIQAHQPDLRVRLETEYSEYLSKYVEEGILDFAVIYTPQPLPGLQIEKLLEDQLVLVSTKPGEEISDIAESYIYLDWGYGYRQKHRTSLPGLAETKVTIGNPDVALAYMQQHGGSAYFPLADISAMLDRAELHVVAETPIIKRPCYLTFPEQSDKPELLSAGLDAMRTIVSRMESAPT